jgi:uncharacterized membrane protein
MADGESAAFPQAQLQARPEIQSDPQQQLPGIALPNFGFQMGSAFAQVAVQQNAYSGQIPPPEMLLQFNQVAPGTAERLIQWAEDETKHRHHLEASAQAANIDAQKRQLEIADRQVAAVFRSDMVGQLSGLLVCLACVVLSFICAMHDHPVAATALAAVPCAAIIQAFRGNVFARKPSPSTRPGTQIDRPTGTAADKQPDAS